MSNRIDIADFRRKRAEELETQADQLDYYGIMPSEDATQLRIRAARLRMALGWAALMQRIAVQP